MLKRSIQKFSFVSVFLGAIVLIMAIVSTGCANKVDKAAITAAPAPPADAKPVQTNPNKPGPVGGGDGPTSSGGGGTSSESAEVAAPK